MTSQDAIEHVEQDNGERAPARPSRRTAPEGSPLDQRLDLGRLGWFGIGAAVVLLAAIGLRFADLTAYAFSRDEGDLAHRAWSLYTGTPLPDGAELPAVGPLYLILQAGTFFLFGVSDAIARSFPVLTGIGLVAMIFALRPVLPRSAVIGMGLLAAVSPTLVFASRSISPAIVIAFLSLFALVSVVRAGTSTHAGSAYWSGMAGLALAGLLASGPEGISAIIALAIGVAVAVMTDASNNGDRRGVIATGLASIVSTPTTLMSAAAGFLVTVVILFSRLLSNASSLEGIFTTFADWGRMMATTNSTTPTQFFLYATLLYEIIAVVLAIVAITAGPASASHDGPVLRPTVFVAWFVAALILQSLASGRQPDQLSLVTLPLVMLGGIGLGRVIERVNWQRMLTTRDGLLVAATLGLFISVIGVITLIARTNDAVPGSSSDAWWRVAFITCLIVIPMSYLVAREMIRGQARGIAGWSALLVVTILLGIYTIRSTTQLAYVRADEGVELAAQGVPAPALRSFVDRTYRLSRDLSITEMTNIDNSGSFGLSIAIDPAIDAPFTWYFRDFDDLRVTSPAGWSDADLVIAPTGEGMEAAGYIVQSRTMFNRVPADFESLSFGSIFGTLIDPADWYHDIRILLFRELEHTQEPQQVSVGYTFELSNQMDPASGPFDLETGQSLGPGSALGQLNLPTGIALSNDGQTIYIVDSGNRRIQRFGIDGTFIGSLSAEDDPRLGLGFFDGANQGAGDIVIGPDDLVYVADTWNHRIMVLDAEGQLVREFGRTGEQTDLLDSPDPTGQPGLFFGPRSVAVFENEIFVSDTGNERIQVFAPDGTFLRAFGGYGTEPGKLIEPVGVTIGADGNVYVADTGNGRISIFTRAGEPVAQVAVPSWQGSVNQQSYLKTGPDGVVYVSSPNSGQIEAFNGTEFVPVQGPQLTGPVGMAITQDNQMLVTMPIDSAEIQFPIQLPPGFMAPGAATPGASPVASPVPAEQTEPPAGTPEPTLEPVG